MYEALTNLENFAGWFSPITLKNPKLFFQPKELHKEDDLFWNIVEVEASQEIMSAAEKD